MVLFLSFVLMMVAIALLVGVVLDYFFNRHPRAKRPRRSRLTYEQFEEMKTWGQRVESD